MDWGEQGEAVAGERTGRFSGPGAWLEKLMGHLRERGRAGRAALPARLLWNAVFIYGSVDPCFSWEITSPRAGGSWQDVSKEGSLPPQLALGDPGVAAGEALEEEEGGPPAGGAGDGCTGSLAEPLSFPAQKEAGD